jgi:hypothetical protein
MTDFIKSEDLGKNGVRYIASDSRTFIYKGGTRAWRNNNPGNIRKPGLTKFDGIIGIAGGFLVFSSYDTGFAALQSLLKKDFYQKLAIFDAVKKYAPAKDNNDVKRYQQIIVQITKVDLKTKLSALAEEQFLLICQAIQRIEGFKNGTIAEEAAKKKILDVKKNEENLIIQYLIEGYGWLRKDKAISLVRQDIVDAVVVKNTNGYIFLRSRPDKSKKNNLDP